MTSQHRALKLRIYPTQEQQVLINKTFGCCRQVYNTRLYEKCQFYENVIKPETDKSKQKELWKLQKLSTEKELKEKFEYMKEVSSVALQQSRMDCEQSFKNFFNSIKRKTNNKQKFPKFKSKKTTIILIEKFKFLKIAWILITEKLKYRNWVKLNSKTEN